MRLLLSATFVALYYSSGRSIHSHSSEPDDWKTQPLFGNFSVHQLLDSCSIFVMGTDQICEICCVDDASESYLQHTEMEWRTLRINNKTIHFPDCHGFRVCDQCISQCHQCPFCRRKRKQNDTRNGNEQLQFFLGMQDDVWIMVLIQLGLTSLIMFQTVIIPVLFR